MHTNIRRQRPHRRRRIYAYTYMAYCVLCHAKAQSMKPVCTVCVCVRVCACNRSECAQTISCACVVLMCVCLCVSTIYLFWIIMFCSAARPGNKSCTCKWPFRHRRVFRLEENKTRFAGSWCCVLSFCSSNWRLDLFGLVFWCAYAHLCCTAPKSTSVWKRSSLHISMPMTLTHEQVSCFCYAAFYMYMYIWMCVWKGSIQFRKKGRLLHIFGHVHRSHLSCVFVYIHEGPLCAFRRKGVTH